MEINSNHSTYGAAFRQKPIFFMSGKETVAFFEGKLKKNMTLQEDSCTLGSNDTYRRQHTTYEVSDKKKGSTFLDLDFLIKDETSSLKGIHFPYILDLKMYVVDNLNQLLHCPHILHSQKRTTYL